MSEPYTPGALRALGRASLRARRDGRAQVAPRDLLLALGDDEDSRSAELLERHGLACSRVPGLLSDSLLDPAELLAADEPRLPSDPVLQRVLGEAQFLARQVDRGGSVATEHLLVALLAEVPADREVLTQAGLDVAALRAEVVEVAQGTAEPIPVPGEIPPLELDGPADSIELVRILDASANRAGEGLRVVEDYVRFVLDDPLLTRRLKDVRHRFGEAVRALDPEARLAARDTSGDVGTHITTPTEQARENPRAVLSANFRRSAEALRSLEEYTKLDDVWLASRFEVLRYDLYTLEKLVLTAAQAHRALGDARLYLLVGGLPTLGDLRWLVGEALAGGVQVVQLREKGLDDRAVLARARELRRLTREAGAWLILNDRADLARLCGADGVHVGQDDLPAPLARRVLGPGGLVGVSTHDPEQLDRAVRDGASYLGVGPVYPGATKSFEAYAGLALVRQAAGATSLPWFAIGGIDRANLPDVIEAGARRVAVSGAILRAERPRAEAAALRALVDAAG